MSASVLRCGRGGGTLSGIGGGFHLAPSLAQCPALAKARGFPAGGHAPRRRARPGRAPAPAPPWRVRRAASWWSPSPSSSPRRFSSLRSGTGRGARAATGDCGRRLRLSELTPRQSAELEDALVAKFNGAGQRHDHRVVDPILGERLSRRGLDWIRVSVPSSSAFRGNFTDGEDDDDDDGSNLNYGGDRDRDSIIVTLRPPTLLHPKLSDIADNVAQFVQEETVSLMTDNSRSEWFAGANKEIEPSTMLPQNVGVTIKISRGEPNPSSSNRSVSDGNSLHQGKALRGVAHFLAVYSCKGGVGKSTVAANLAFRLASLGGRVGLLDLDVYGPSLPLLVRPADAAVRRSPLGDNMVEPLVHNGVRLMSLGYVSPDCGVPGAGPGAGAAVLRGPMAGRVASQLLRGTNWGDLDVLIMDLPPGTGDVQLEVCQSLSLAGAVAVSTPSNLAWADVRKGVTCITTFYCQLILNEYHNVPLLINIRCANVRGARRADAGTGGEHGVLHM